MKSADIYIHITNYQKGECREYNTTTKFRAKVTLIEFAMH